MSDTINIRKTRYDFSTKGYFIEYRDGARQAETADLIGLYEDMWDALPEDAQRKFTPRVFWNSNGVSNVTLMRARAEAMVAFLLGHVDDTTKAEFAAKFAVPDIKGDG
jgi:hypothetical protein